MQCKNTEHPIAYIKKGFANKPTFNIEESSDKAFIAFNISIITKTVSDNVDAFIFP